MQRRVSVLVTVFATAAAMLLAGCGGSALRPDQMKSGRPGAETTLRPANQKMAGPAKTPESKPKPAPDAPVSADVLVYSSSPLPTNVIAGIEALPSVVATTVFSMGSVYNGEQPITYAAVDPATFRFFTPPGTAQTDGVWERVSQQEMAIRPALGKELVDDEDYITLGNVEDAPRIHVGAYAELAAPPPASRWLDAIVDQSWANRLVMPHHNALLLSTGSNAVEPILKKMRAMAGDNVAIHVLAHVFDASAVQTAVLTGTSLATAVGSFSYTANSNGTVNPDPRWVSANIRTEVVPILGKVTCHKVMLVQLRAALNEVVQRGLANKIHPGEFGGCYYPRYIARNPAKGLSFHTWGTALDINVPGNLRGTVGQIDRSVVAIFVKWGFNWGGTWRYTDPMHFELARIVKVG